MSTALVVEGAHRETAVADMARLSLIRYAKYALAPLALLVVSASLLLKPFGATYVDHGATLLRLFLLATIPHAVISLYFGLERVRARVGRVLLFEALIVALVTGGALAGMHRFGLVGIGIAWLGAHTLVALLVAPSFCRACRRGPATTAGPESYRRGPYAAGGD
jgi:O-antigen/teichoic acid export membrane protein